MAAPVWKEARLSNPCGPARWQSASHVATLLPIAACAYPVKRCRPIWHQPSYWLRPHTAPSYRSRTRYTALANVGGGNSRQKCWPACPCCAAMQACSTFRSSASMKTTQRTAPAHARTWAHHFEASSVLLFAALTFGAAGAVQAQSGSTSSPSHASKSVIGLPAATRRTPGHLWRRQDHHQQRSGGF